MHALCMPLLGHMNSQTVTGDLISLGAVETTHDLVRC